MKSALWHKESLRSEILRSAKKKNSQIADKFILVFIFLFKKKKYEKNLRTQREQNGIETSETYFLGLQ